mmetsp:Transcript_27478/g.34006  ORF Transcript_27478/g.34006 Transcript_27478/m.34006 type:complete len:82 (+) Transcript_27478:1311-1556(+)
MTMMLRSPIQTAVTFEPMEAFDNPSRELHADVNGSKASFMWVSYARREGGSSSSLLPGAELLEVLLEVRGADDTDEEGMPA